LDAKLRTVWCSLAKSRQREVKFCLGGVFGRRQNFLLLCVRAAWIVGSIGCRDKQNERSKHDGKAVDEDVKWSEVGVGGREAVAWQVCGGGDCPAGKAAGKEVATARSGGIRLVWAKVHVGGVPLVG